MNEPGSKPASGNAIEATYRDIPIDVDGNDVFQQGIEIIVNSKMKLIMERESLKRAADNWEESKEMEEWRVKL